MFGVRLTGPEGSFPIDQFTSVLVERISPPVDAYGGPHTRISLVGKETTPTILVGRMGADAGRALGRELATVLNLPLDETSAPY